MNSLKRPKLLIVIFVVCIVAVAISLILGLSSNLITSNKSSNTIKSTLTNSNSKIEAVVNNNFEISKLDQPTQDLLRSNNINQIDINITNIPTKITTAAYTITSTTVIYDGYDVKKQDNNLIVDLYINSSILSQLAKTDEQIQFDTLQQLFLAFSDYQQSLVYGENITKDKVDQGLTNRYQQSALQAESLVNNNNIPFTIKKI